MSILSIESIYQDGGTIYVTALVEDAVQTHSQTYYDPAEYGPAVCEASFTIDDEELREFVLPDNDLEMIEFLEELDLEWNPVDNSDDYFE
jgi:hypothetical protein